MTVERYVGWVDRRLVLPPVDARLLHSAVQPYSGETLAPKWSQDEQKNLSAALDLLRPLLLEAGNPTQKKKTKPSSPAMG